MGIIFGISNFRMGGWQGTLRPLGHMPGIIIMQPKQLGQSFVQLICVQLNSQYYIVLLLLDAYSASD